jgi:single-strand DNA-binding protein
MRNDVLLVGRLGGNPKVTTFGDGSKVAEFSLATDQKWKDRNTGERKSKTTWHRVKCYRGLAGVVEQYLGKGSKILAKGSYLNETYTDKNGVERRSFFLRMEDMDMLDMRKRDARPEDTPMTAERYGPTTFEPAPDKKEDDGSNDLPF